MAQREFHDWQPLCERMVHDQLEARGITDPHVLKAMRETPRHLFVPHELQPLAYRDSPLPIGNEQTISQPFIVAYMTQCLGLTGTETVLEIGTGSGYQTAILCKLARHVYTIERHNLLAERAAANLAQPGIENVDLHVGDGSQGLPDMAPYDAIIVTAAAPALPIALRAQLSEGACMVLPVGDNSVQYLERIRRCGNTWNVEQLISVMFVLLIGRYGFSQRATGAAGR